MHPLLNIATKAARRAGDIIMRGLDRLDTVTITEKQPNDFVTDVDQRAEQTIINIIRQSYPNHGILAEESGNSETSDDYLWIIDPLDGTRNFIHGLPHFCVSIAVKFKGRIEIGLVYDPVRQEIFTASRGEGAKLNDRRIRVSDRTELNGAFLATGFPARTQSNSDKQLTILKTLNQESVDLRQPGSAALDLAYVAAGRFDGYWEFDLCPWDIAAGILLVKEAGGLVTDIQGQEDYFNNGSVVAANAKLIKKMFRVFMPIL
jgi:myo-inositol-1(or 4)-monophosphatase